MFRRDLMNAFKRGTMMKTSAVFIRPAACFTVIFITALLLLPESASAIPAFARKYRMSCTTCHAPAPRLKSYGEDFAGNAFQLEDKEAPRSFYDTGDDILTLQRELPLAIRFDAFVQYKHYTDEDCTNDLQTPYGMKILSGGNISDRIGYYLYFYMSERGEVAGIEDAYLHFNNLFGVDFDIMVGQFQVSDPLFKRELRLTFEDYELYRVKIGLSPTNLTYDRGIMVTYGSPIGMDVVFEVVNGNGKGEAVSGLFDSDEWKNVSLRLSQQVGPLRLGGFGYFGKNIDQSWVRKVENELYYLGADGTLDIGEYLQINGQILYRKDDNPYFKVTSPFEVETGGGLVEVIWAVNGEMGRPFVTFLYNNVDSELNWLDYRTETLSFSYLLRRNLRLLAEATFNEEEESWRLVTGMVSAF